MKRPSTPLAVAALTALLLPISALRAAPADAIPANPLINVQCEGITINAGTLTLGNGGTGVDSTNGLVSDDATGVVNVSTAFLTHGIRQASVWILLTFLTLAHLPL